MAKRYKMLVSELFFVDKVVLSPEFLWQFRIKVEEHCMSSIGCVGGGEKMDKLANCIHHNERHNE